MCLTPNSIELSKSLSTSNTTTLTNHQVSGLAKQDDLYTFASVLHVNYTLLNYETGSEIKILTHLLSHVFYFLFRL